MDISGYEELELCIQPVTSLKVPPLTCSLACVFVSLIADRCMEITLLV